MRAFYRTHILTALALFTGSSAARAESEASVKAAYLFNFAKLVEWPSSAFSSGKAPLVIGVMGREAVGDELARACASATAGGHPVEVRRVSMSEVRDCHLVYVPESERGDGAIAAAQGAPVLVVGEGENFARRGGALAFVKDSGTLKFDANPAAAARNGLTVSAKLLRVARTVVPK